MIADFGVLLGRVLVVEDGVLVLPAPVAGPRNDDEQRQDHPQGETEEGHEGEGQTVGGGEGKTEGFLHGSGIISEACSSITHRIGMRRENSNPCRLKKPLDSALSLTVSSVIRLKPL